MSCIAAKVFLVYLFFFCVIIASKKLRSPGFDSLKTNKLSDCGRCKALADSFNYWLDKTSRGKFEGGDAAWEETKLKSYARSEVRLVEVQEGLCSELNKHQDDCYILADEAEQVLEKWWFQEDPNSIDLHTWLCIETLKYCCPVHQFGETCTPCPLDKDNNICSGHGKCDGDGTRIGNGTCICQRGYSGMFCEECAQNFYSKYGSCEPCHWACDGCSGEGPTACHTCKSGWQLESGVCVDIDECASPPRCKSNQYCFNKEGSFKCEPCDLSCKTCAGVGAKNCTSCKINDFLWSGMCITKTQKNDILNSTIKRLCLYLGLLVISFIIFRTSKRLAAIVVLIISIYIYYLETSNMNLLNVLYNISK